MTKYTVKLSEEDYQMLKDCHSKNPSIMKALEEAKKEDQTKQKNRNQLIANHDFLFIF